MNDNKTNEWERVTHTTQSETSRMPVPGGWLVLVEQWYETGAPGTPGHRVIAMSFVPDPAHLWRNW